MVLGRTSTGGTFGKDCLKIGSTTSNLLLRVVESLNDLKEGKLVFTSVRFNLQREGCFVVSEAGCV